MECIELNWLCKHVIKFNSSQASISINSCTELSKAVFPWSIVKTMIPSSTFVNILKPTIVAISNSFYANSIQIFIQII